MPSLSARVEASVQMVLLPLLLVVPLTAVKKDIKAAATIMVVQVALVAAVNSEMVVQTEQLAAVEISVMAALGKVQQRVNLVRMLETCMLVEAVALFTKHPHILAALAVAVMVMLLVRITLEVAAGVMPAVVPVSLSSASIRRRQHEIRNRN